MITRFPSPRRRGRLVTGGFVVVMLLVVLGIVVPVMTGYYDERTVTTEVVSKERVCSGNSDGGTDCKYLVFTDDGTFEITDSLIIGRFDSSDVYGRIREGRTYKISYIGWRLPLFSTYPNIKNITEVTP